ncbi:cell division protein FtsZ [Flavobacteriaceae bacterium]|jgi:cell division protein FtsZ|nr:cell division protein FtsZ [Flavobacteriaceae bacterium]MDA9037286.1 cell division protein FtsZ [Flavobacteriaceae bacterium]MDA9851108.1 cell division protein FtsZ [Flavobacteriaceae bacterium]MDC0386644.1 cell division protein FtsZ [Flavobacteriaceae bacterium]MDC0871870.1 cell division protein FtsZ [Flavobacteriaceae bacterium]
MDQEETKGINFDLPKNRSNVIKVIGVGGGGSNAINYMFQQGIKGVDFVITNTDAQALSESGVPTKIQLGASLTEGLGAGANPEIGAQAAQESQAEIQSILSTQTKMVFITAGMGGGTGTGAAPVIAQMAKSLDILTVGIVTMPFQFEGRLRLEQAQKGLERIKESVDALIVINNNKLREVYGNLGFKAGFAKADEVLATAARGIAEVITHHYTQNIDLKDAKTVLTNSGTAIMGSGAASGSNRAQEAIVKALDSPLLNDNKISGCKNVLLLIVSGTDEITIDEIGEINDYIQTEAGNHTNIIMGVGDDESLGNEISVTVIATGFGKEQQNEISNTEAKKIIHSLEDEQKIVHDLSEDKKENSFGTLHLSTEPFLESVNSSLDENKEPLIAMNSILSDIEVEAEVVFNGTDSNKDMEAAPSLKEEAFLFDQFDSENEAITWKETQEEPSTVAFQEETEMNSFVQEEPSFSEDTNSNFEATIQEEMPVESESDEFELSKISNELEEPTEIPLFEPQFEDVSETLEETEMPEAFSSEFKEPEEEFIFNEVSNPLFEMDVVDPEIVESESQILMDFELPIADHKSQEQTNQMQREEVAEESVVIEKDFENASLEVRFELKTTSEETDVPESIVEDENLDLVTEEDNPFEQTIDQTIAKQSEKRKTHLKAFNHKFSHQYQKVEEMEKEPAYKRKGLDLDASLPESPSRLSLDNDSNDDLQIRSNNSFLHDNVD